MMGQISIKNNRETDNCSNAVASEMRRNRAISWIRWGHALSVSGAATLHGADRIAFR